MQDERLKLNKQALAAFLHMGFVPEPNTMFDKIWKFPAGHYGIFTKAGYNISSYFKVEWHKDHHGKNAKVLHEEFDLVLRKAVEKRLFADVPYGALLSGGIDSSLVCAYASDLSKEKLKTFTIGFEDRNKDERIYAEQVARALNTQHYSFVLKEKDALEKVALLDTVYDEAFLDSSAIPTMLVSERTISEKVLQLFHKLYSKRMLIRLIGVKFSNLIAGSYQADLFDDTLEDINLSKAMDKIRMRYGHHSVVRGFALLNP